MRTMKLSVAPLLLAGACLFAGCSGLTDVKVPGILMPDAVANTTGAIARYYYGIQIFARNLVAVTGTSGTFVDEFYGTDYVGNDGEGFLTDARRPYTPGFPTTRSNNFTSLSGALVNLGYAVEALRQYAATPTWRAGHMLALTAYTELFLAEEYCNGIPLSTITANGVVTYGSGTSTAEVYARALAHFDSAIAALADSARLLNIARVGKGRTLVDLGRYAEAATAVSAVPTSFLFNMEYSTNTSLQNNYNYSTVVLSKYRSVAEKDGGNGLNFRTANDPRVPITNLGFGQDGVSPLYNFAKFDSYASPITLASGIEARLIEAEAALQANRNDAATTGTGWLGVLNTLRGSSINPAMTPLADPGSFDARVNLLMRERAFWMFATSHRMADVRRLVRLYGRAVAATYPSGLWKDGLPYGTEVDFNVPLSEAPNANFKACTSRGA